jgi:mRNA interferase RelE/StbE
VTVVWTGRARRDLRGIDRQQQKRILDAVDHFAETGEGDVKALRGDDAAYRLRVGDYRVLFDKEGLIVSVVRVAHRREAYR